ncbi:peptidoglycan DD-metalloendopeptidase family protein [Aerophototrophica crusticola]|uniref:Peptidoglycan DD-metalloendopeptidase family protein n=1 Tax=Aerophototrophica crusticola TaxID=1709002 RepID=A0A858R7B0_9PROT|nr:peptidoglycan DD-metalloendopeptidase family protein [Rhodospirillaceae bacterium B3]
MPPAPRAITAATAVAAALIGSLLALAPALPAAAQGTAPSDPAAAGQKLREVERNLEQGTARQKELDAQAEALERELVELRARLIQSAEQARAQEQELARLEQALADLSRQEGERVARIDADRAALAELLGALQRLSRLPPEVLLARPQPPADTVKSALLLRAAVPELRDRADALAKELEGLAALRQDLARQRGVVEASAATLAKRQDDIRGLVSRREELSRATDAERDKVTRQVAQLATRASDLKDLLEKLETQRKEAEARQKAAEAARRAAAEAERERKAKDRVAALGTGKGLPRLGGMEFPVGGDVVTRYGEQDELGTTSRGLTLKGRAGGPVVAPYDGSVMFAGPFKGYGLILILEHAHGYHSLLAGLGKIDAQVGQRVLTGEPVGSLAKEGTPTMYFELRRAGQPINPLRGLAAPDGKGQG